MGMKIEAVPLEILSKILDYSTLKDVLNLRACNKRLNSSVIHADFWKKKAYICWIDHLKSDPILNTRLMLSDTDNNDYNWFQFYQEYYKTEHEVLSEIQTILFKLSSMSSYLIDCERVFSRDTMKLLLILNNIIERLKSGAEEKCYDNPLEIISLCKRIVVNLRVNIYLEDYSSSYPSSIFDLEFTVALPFSLLDPCYDSMIKYRKSFYSKVSAYLKDKHSTIDNFINLSTTQRVCEITEYLNKYFKTNTTIPYHSNNLNDYGILRIYANYNIGITLFQLIIFQKILSIYSIKSVVCNNILTIRGNDNSHLCYILIEKNGVFKTVDKKDMYAILCQLYTQSRSLAPRNDFIRNFFLPIDANILRRQLLEAICDSDEIITNHISNSSDDMDLNIFNYVNGYINNSLTPSDYSLSDQVTYPLLFNKLYPKSLNEGIKLPFSYYWNIPIDLNYKPILDDIGMIEVSETTFQVLLYETLKDKIYMRRDGTVFRSHSSIVLEHCTDSSQAEISNFIQLISILHYGKFFKYFDWDSCRFVPNNNYSRWILSINHNHE